MDDTAAHVDAVIIGGGIAGLWSAARLTNAGYGVLLVENRALGSQQSIASQGILHGGVKYALTASDAARSVALMPERWQATLHRSDDTTVYLPAVRTISDAQYLWTTGSLFELLTAKAAAAAIRTNVRAVSASQACPALRDAPRSVSIHRVEEPIIDPYSLVKALRDSIVEKGGIIAHTECAAPIDPHSHSVNLQGTTVRFSTLILAAGAGNERLLTGIAGAPQMQLRPLQMVLARGHDLPEMFGHCLNRLSDKPRLTITTQTDNAGRRVWYIGGQPAEEGVNRSPSEQIRETRAEIAACLPWVPLTNTQWATFRVDRAEGRTRLGNRPDGPVFKYLGSFDTKHLWDGPCRMVVWPTKLVFAPQIGDEARFAVDYYGERHGIASLEPLRGLFSEPPIAPLPWDREDIQWS